MFPMGPSVMMIIKINVLIIAFRKKDMLCKVALDQGRFTYRHDQILLYLLKTLAAPGLEGLTFHSDLEGWKVGGGSIPPEIVVTS